MSRPVSKNWAEARRLYDEGMSMPEIAKAIGAARSMLYKHAKAKKSPNRRALITRRYEIRP